MASKKKQKEKKTPSSSSSRSNKPSAAQSSSSASSSGPRLQISAENESRLRRLLLNSSSSKPSQTPKENLNTLSTAQHAKRLRSVYEKLSCEGFADEQIERALSALKDGATFENALDWLCLNLEGNELPLKFSSGSSLYTGAGSVSVISTGLGQAPSNRSSRASEDVPPGISVRTKGKHQEDDSLDSLKPSQADWIKRYVEEQDEDEDATWEDHLSEYSSFEEVHEPRSYDIIAQEYYGIRMEALIAKEKGDKQSQERAGRVIRKLKQELATIGLSVDILASIFEAEHAPNFVCKDKLDTTLHQKQPQPQVVSSCDTEDDAVSIPLPPTSTDKIFLEGCSSKEPANMSTLLNVSIEKQSASTEELEDVELGGFFEEDTTYQNDLGPEKTKKLSSSNNLEPLVGIWKKGEPPKIPKALLHQLCQKSGWEAPKFNKIPRKDNSFSYKISILRKASGRGKSRKAGGLVTLQLPDQDAAFESSEEAQNRVTAFALNQLFPDVPVHLAIAEPYASLVIRWKEGESSADVENILDDRRADFVDSLLKAKDFRSDSTVPEEFRKPQSEVTLNYPAAFTDTKAKGVNSYKESESSLLKQELESKKKTKRYKNMLDSRAALPIAELKGEILHLLKENDALVVCGETGSGKTTQVPQFILDDMIEAGSGGDCSIVCTQPRRIAAISVAERVADERCEPSPGTNGSVVGYQVRLDSARNEKTKLLFCTTGILLRKIAGDKNLSDVTHVIVDEVHERSLLGDFLLIVLKNLIEKQTNRSEKKLKVILMSATVDSKLFSNYFSNCPVVTTMGRTHPVTTYFLEDVYESINYRLESDSPACIKFDTHTKQSHPVNNSRGNRNLVLSGWGDDSVLLDECINPYYASENYQSYSQHTRQNLKKLNEDVIDYDLLEDLVCHIDETCPAGAILVFLPGVSEINMLLDKLSVSYRFGGPSSDWLLPLHSSVAPVDQKKVLVRPPESIRKVIIATNIAETSITIDDVVYVVDCGKHKENRYNPQKKLSSMVEDWISRANAKQRKGRAGRVKPGICFCLYTRYRFEKLMRPFQVPEILRMPLVELCLQIKLLSLGNIRHFLSQALEPPREESITSAISLLYEVGAVERDEELTPLGYHLAKLPVDVLIGKMLVYGGIFGCLSPILSVSAFLSHKSPFVYPKDERQNVEGAKVSLLTDKLDGYSNTDGVDRQSDHMLMMVAYKKWEKILREKGSKAAQQFCNSYFLSSSVMYMIRDMRIQFGTLLADIGLIDLPKNCEKWGKKKENLDVWLSDSSQPFNMNSQHAAVVKAIICAGLYPNVAATEEGIAGAVLSNLKNLKSSSTVTGERPVLYDRKREVHIHPSSINNSSKALRYPFVVFLEKVETNKIFLRDTTIVSPYSILLFGGSIDVQHQAGVVTIDGWLKLTAAAQTAVLFKQLRLTLQDVLKEFIRKPQKATAKDNEVVRSIVHLLLEEAK